LQIDMGKFAEKVVVFILSWSSRNARLTGCDEASLLFPGQSVAEVDRAERSKRWASLCSRCSLLWRRHSGHRGLQLLLLWLLLLLLCPLSVALLNSALDLVEKSTGERLRRLLLEITLRLLLERALRLLLERALRLLLLLLERTYGLLLLECVLGLLLLALRQEASLLLLLLSTSELLCCRLYGLGRHWSGLASHGGRCSGGLARHGSRPRLDSTLGIDEEVVLRPGRSAGRGGVVDGAEFDVASERWNLLSRSS